VAVEIIFGGRDHLDVRRRVERIVRVDREQRLAGARVGDEQPGHAAAQRAAQQLLDLPRGVLLDGQRLLAAADHLARGAQIAGAVDRDAGVRAVVRGLLRLGLGRLAARGDGAGRGARLGGRCDREHESGERRAAQRHRGPRSIT
jgi:hypothetical protein